MSDGAARIAWARARMPVLAAVAASALEPLAGRRIAISLPLDPTTAVLALTLRDAGATVAVHAPPAETDAAVATALAEQEVTVFARTDADDRAARDGLLDALLDTRPQLLVDDGAHAIRRAHQARRDVLATLEGAAEETTSGVRPLRAMDADGELAIPVIAVDDARTKQIADNGHGTGQSCIAAILDVSGIMLAGKRVVVAGYGPVGRGVARHAAALGAHVTVSELDPHRALEALLDGCAVAPLRESARRAELLISATGVTGTVGLDVLRLLPDGALVAVAGGVAQEVATDALRAAAGTPAPLAPQLDAYALDGRRLLLLADGECVNIAAAEGNPIETMDCSLALQALALGHLAGDGAALPPGLHALPPRLDAHVARLRLAAAGARLERP